MSRSLQTTDGVRIDGGDDGFAPRRASVTDIAWVLLAADDRRRERLRAAGRVSWVEIVGRPHHTAVVAANNGAKGLVILEQNLFQGTAVQRNVLHLANGVIKKESKTISEPGPGGKKQLVGVEVTTSVEVTGQIWAYRAQAKQ